jgi:hypothetical protein
MTLKTARVSYKIAEREILRWQLRQAAASGAYAAAADPDQEVESAVIRRNSLPSVSMIRELWAVPANAAPESLAAEGRQSMAPQSGKRSR